MSYTYYPQPGLDGEVGTTGPQGLPGPQGVKGDTGNTGPKGDQGDKGDTGSTGPQGPSGTISLFYGNFYDTTTQNNASIIAENVVSIGTLANANGVHLQSGSRVVFENAGAYLINFLGQFITTGGGSNYMVTVWFKLNGTVVPNSAFTFTTAGVNQQVLANLETIYHVNANDYVEFCWSSQNQYMKLLPTAAGTSPTRPESPSVNLVIYNVG